MKRASLFWWRKETSTSAMRVWVSSLVAALIFCAAPAHADLIVNGSFELPVVPNHQAVGVASFTVTQIPGWTVLPVGDVQLFGADYQEPPLTFNAQSGNQFIDTSGYLNQTGSGVEQLVPTQTGHNYELSFYVGKAGGLDLDPIAGVVDLSINGGVPLPYANFNTTINQINWEQFTVDFTATSGNTTLTFTFGSEPPNNFAGLDNVTLDELPANSVPEPSTLVMSLILFGMFSVVWLSKRRMPSFQK